MTVVPLPDRMTRGSGAPRRPGGVSIRELAARTGATLRALRHYEDIGLLTAGRGPTGSRLYDADQRRTAGLITRLRRLGMPVRDIRLAVADERPEADRAALVARYVAAEAARAAARLQELRTTLAELEVSGLDGLASEPARRPAELRNVR